MTLLHDVRDRADAVLDTTTNTTNFANTKRQRLPGGHVVPSIARLAHDVPAAS